MALYSRARRTFDIDTSNASRGPRLARSRDFESDHSDERCCGDRSDGRFGHDFSKLNVLSDAQSAQIAQPAPGQTQPAKPDVEFVKQMAQRYARSSDSMPADDKKLLPGLDTGSDYARPLVKDLNASLQSMPKLLEK